MIFDKKYLLIIIFLLVILISCTKIDIITDPYWIDIVSDLQGTASGLKLQSILNGKTLKLSISDLKGEFPSQEIGLSVKKSDIYLLSPLLSTKVSTFAKANSKSLIYYFGNTEEAKPDIGGNTVLIERDRRKAFFKMGTILSVELAANSMLPIIYNVEDQLQNRETMSFIDGVKSIDKSIVFLYMIINSSTPEGEIRTFFNKTGVKNSQYVVIFSNKWKNISYELSERDNKQIITSDSWFSKIYASNILFSVEDDIKGMLKKVYNNEKMGKHGKILLDGSIHK